MKLVKYFLQKKAVTILLLVLILAGGLFSYIKIGENWKTSPLYHQTSTRTDSVSRSIPPPRYNLK